MIRSSCQHARPRILVPAALSFLFFTSGVTSYSKAQDSFPSEAIKSLKNSDIEWDGSGAFARAGPAVVGANAKQVAEFDVKVTENLIPLLDKPDSFIVAHVLLTRSWRISAKDKERICIPTSTGFFVGYNGLIVKIDWKDVSGQITKTVTIPDMDLQQKRIGYWWKTRFRDFPSEFSPKTRVD